MTHQRIGWIIAGVTLVFDQITKYWMLDLLDWGARGRIAVMPSFDLVLVWNRGISYGLFQQDGPVGPWILVGLAAAASVFCAFWLRRAESRVLAVGLGLLIGGAVGNGIDRAFHGAVIDFVSLYYGDFYWYVFNIADAAIVAAVAALLYDSFARRPNPAENSE